MKNAGISFSAAKTLSRADQDSAVQRVFALPLPAKGKASYGSSVDAKGNIILLALDEVRSGSMPEAQKKTLIQGMTQNNAQITFEALMDSLRKEAKIKLGDVVSEQQ